MAYQLRLRRGNAAQHAAFTGAIGEITFNTSNNTVHGHDGNTLGGFEVALKSDLANLDLSNAIITASADLSGNTTDDLPEGNANLYFSNARAIGALTAGERITIESNGLVVGAVDVITSVNGALGNVVLTTANITEDTNLYFTNTRALAAVADNISTSNVAEGANLYFTNTRAIASLTAGSGVTIEANGMLVSTAVSNSGGTVTSVGIDAGALIDVTGSPITTSGNITISVDLSELSTTTNTALADHLVVIDSETANQFKILKSNIPLSHFDADITTSNVAEGANLYFTNARSIGALTAGQNIGIAANGLISTGAGTGDLTAVETDIRPATDKTLDLGNTTNRWNVLYANVLSFGNIFLGESGFGLYVKTNLSSNVNLFTTDYIGEGETNLYFSNAKAIAAVTGQSVGILTNDVGYLSDGNISTSNIIEGANLYFTNTRAIGALTAGVGVVIESNGLVISTSVTGVESVNGAVGNVVLTTANIAEQSNLYFTNARVAAALTAGIITTDKIAAGAVTADKIAVGAVTADKLNSITTSNIAEGANLYFSNTRALAAVQDVISTSNVLEEVNLYFTNIRAVAAVADNISTSNVTEGDNLYFTGQRVLDALTTVAGNIIPVGNTYNLGSAANAWNNIYVGNVVLNGGISTSATGVPTIESDTSLRLTANDAVVVTSSPFQLASFTFAEIQNMIAVDGMMVYDTTNAAVQTYANGSWGTAYTGSQTGNVISVNGGYVDNRIVRYSGTSGNNIQNSSVTIADDGAITAPNNTGSMIPFYYANVASFPVAANSHGAIAHAHDTGKMYYAHGGSWLELANMTDVSAGSGTVTSVGGAGTVNGLTLTGTVTSSGNLVLGGTLAIAATQVTSGTLAVDRGGTGVTTSTGTGNTVLSTSPTLVTPILGTPQSVTLTNATGLPIDNGTTGTLPVARGGTGTTAPSLVAGNNVTISGTWPNQTVNATAGSSSISWSISAADSTNYTFSGPGIVAGNTTDPVLYLYRGFTYEFVNTTGGSHPFAIRVSNGGTAYTAGVSGSQTGTQTFTVPMNAPSTLYYQCTLHSSMGNTINIV